MFGRNEKRLAEAELVGIGQLDLGVVEVRLVDDQHHVFFAAAQPGRNALVESGHSGQTVDDEKNHRGGIDGKTDLDFRGGDQFGRRLPTLQPDSAGIEQRVAALLDFGGKDIACDAGLVMDDRNALPRQPVKQPAFTDIGSADDGDSAIHGGRVVSSE